ncbi:Exosome complex component [Nymphaea thermarum]|nr:Exosome complex component [Nymphaea thermarum]
MGPAAKAKEGEVVTPGEVVGKGTEAVAGKGCYLSTHNNTIYASITGRFTRSPPPPGSTDNVTKVMARMASVDIMCVGPKSVKEKFSGIIRQQDVRATEIDKVDMHLSFRPGDIVRAAVKLLALIFLKLSLGDARAYYLSTAKNELGVVSAESIAGATMVPITWTEMQCPLTGQIEPRKVAKVT